MSEFVVELYLPRTPRRRLPMVAERVRRAADEHGGKATRVQLVRSIFLPEEETCLLLFQGDSAAAVGEVVRSAGIAFERITEAVDGDPPERRGGRRG